MFFKVEIKNNDYELIIEPKQFIGMIDPVEMIYTEKMDTIFEIKAAYFNSHEILEVLSPDNKNYKGTSDLINLDFKSEKGIPTDSLLHILETEGYIEKKAKTN